MLRRLLGFNRIAYFHIFVICFFYVPQSVYGFWIYDFDVALKFLCVLLLSCASYSVTYYFYSGRLISQTINRSGRITVKVGTLSIIVFSIYFTLICYAAITANQIPLLSALQGASIGELSEARERFLRTREGWESLLPYLNAALIMVLIPYAISSLFYFRHRLRFFYFAVFLMCLILTLEKSVAILAFLPIVIILINRRSSDRALRVIWIFIVVMAAVSFLARGGLQEGSGQANQEDSAASIPEFYRIFNCEGQLCYLSNRVFWIPYATGIDWLRYFDSELRGEQVLGASSQIGALMFGVERVNLERDVFAYQWGQNETGTGTSNTVYFIDAYLNFSWFGVFLYASFVSLMVKIVRVTDNVPVKAISYSTLVYLSFNSLPSMLFSGGIIIIIFICFVFRQQRGDS